MAADLRSGFTQRGDARVGDVEGHAKVSWTRVWCSEVRRAALQDGRQDGPLSEG